MSTTTMSRPVAANSASPGPGSARPARFRRYPRGSFIAVVDHAVASDRLLGALVAAGVDPAQLTTMNGEEGRRELDRDGRHHGVLARIHRGLVSAHSSESGNVVSLLDSALRQGGALVLVPIRPAGVSAVLDVEALLVEHGSRCIVRFNRWTVSTRFVRRH